VWGSVKEAAKELGIAYSTITNRLNGQKKNNTTLIYIANECD
jgi:molybdenum-dependent DNA-binding transcriptional regulator ModE